jgi:hypothetical protein
MFLEACFHIGFYLIVSIAVSIDATLSLSRVKRPTISWAKEPARMDVLFQTTKCMDASPGTTARWQRAWQSKRK